MGVSSQRSRVSDLAFLVFGRVLHPDWFVTHASARIERPGWSADLRIVEGGHAVHWTCGATRLTEVVTSREADLPEPGLLFHSPVRHERSVTLKPGTTLEYQTCFEAERVDPEIFHHLCEELTLDARRGGLFHWFARSNRMAPPPLSRMAFESRTAGLSVQTVHTFPGEHAIVRTQSLFEVRG